MEKTTKGYLYIPFCEDRKDRMEALPYARETVLIDFRALPRHYRRVLIEETELEMHEVPVGRQVLLEYIPSMPLETLDWMDILHVYHDEVLGHIGVDKSPNESDVVTYLRQKGTSFTHYIDYLTWRNHDVNWEDYTSITVDIPPLKEGELETLLSEESDEFDAI